MTKVCSKCGVEKPWSEFSLRRERGNRPRPACKSCVNSIYNARREKAAKKPRVCKFCGTTPDQVEFHPIMHRCKPCHAAQQRDYVERNREQCYERNKEYRRRNADKIRSKKLLDGYGITLADYEAMHAAQGGRCYICREECPSGRALAVDHCHTTRRVRKLLCARCNSGLGQFRDSPGLLAAAIEYLVEHASETGLGQLTGGEVTDSDVQAGAGGLQDRVRA